MAIAKTTIQQERDFRVAAEQQVVRERKAFETLQERYTQMTASFLEKCDGQDNTTHTSSTETEATQIVAQPTPPVTPPQFPDTRPSPFFLSALNPIDDAQNTLMSSPDARSNGNSDTWMRNWTPEKEEFSGHRLRPARYSNEDNVGAGLHASKDTSQNRPEERRTDEPRGFHSHVKDAKLDHLKIGQQWWHQAWRQIRRGG